MATGTKTRRRTKTFKVHVPKIEGVSDEYVASYILDAVVSWCGQAVLPTDAEEAANEIDEMWLMNESNKMRTIKVSYRNGEGQKETEIGVES